MTASSASFASHPTVCSSRDRTSARCSRSERDKARGSRLELASEVPLAMLRTTPIRREANHEDAVVLDPDRVGGYLTFGAGCLSSGDPRPGARCAPRRRPRTVPLFEDKGPPVPAEPSARLTRLDPVRTVTPVLRWTDEDIVATRSIDRRLPRGNRFKPRHEPDVVTEVGEASREARDLILGQRPRTPVRWAIPRSLAELRPDEQDSDRGCHRADARFYQIDPRDLNSRHGSSGVGCTCVRARNTEDHDEDSDPQAGHSVLQATVYRHRDIPRRPGLSFPGPDGTLVPIV
jgi:hypothetical protein